MKKLMILAALAAASVAAFAAEVRKPADIRKEIVATTNASERAKCVRAVTTDEWRGIFDEIVAIATSDPGLAKHRLMHRIAPGVPTLVEACYKLPAAKGLAAEYDAPLSACGVCMNPSFYDKFPMSCEKNLELNPGYVRSRPATVAAMRRHKAWINGQWSLGERLNARLEQAALGHLCPKLYTKEILAAAPKTIKRMLRERGVSFVARKGEPNPVQKPLDDLVAALNAPKAAGLEAWVKEWCPGYEWIEPPWKSDAEIEKIMDDVYYGQRAFTPAVKTMLTIYLGIEKYNAFVEKYNGTVEK